MTSQRHDSTGRNTNPTREPKSFEHSPSRIDANHNPATPHRSDHTRPYPDCIGRSTIINHHNETQTQKQKVSFFDLLFSPRPLPPISSRLPAKNSP